MELYFYVSQQDIGILLYGSSNCTQVIGVDMKQFLFRLYVSIRVDINESFLFCRVGIVSVQDKVKLKYPLQFTQSVMIKFAEDMDNISVTTAVLLFGVVQPYRALLDKDSNLIAVKLSKYYLSLSKLHNNACIIMTISTLLSLRTLRTDYIVISRGLL